MVIGAGQAGLSASYHLKRRGITHVVLDADDAPGRRLAAPLGLADHAGRARHRGAARTADSPGTPDGRANTVVPAYFGDYERAHDLPVLRPVRVDRVDDRRRPARRARRRPHLDDADGRQRDRHLDPAAPALLPRHRGLPRRAAAHRLATPGPDHFRGRRVVVVGGGASAVQLLGEIAPVAADTLWVTRREPVWRTDEFNPDRGRRGGGAGRGAGTPRAAAGQRRQRDRAGAARAGARGRAARGLRAAPDVHARSSRTAYACPTATLWPADVILWATGFRPAIAHLAPLHLRSEHGGIQLDGTTAVADRRVQLVGYGPSASTIGANRAGRVAARGVAAVAGSGREQRLERLTVGQVLGLDQLAGADVVEGRAHRLERYVVQLGPGEPVDRELERVGGRRPVGLPVDEQVAVRARRRPRRSGRGRPGRPAPARTAPRPGAGAGSRTGRPRRSRSAP